MSVDELLHPNAQTPPAHSQLVSLEREETRKRGEHCEEGSGRHVAMPPVLLEVLSRCAPRQVMHAAAHLHEAIPHRVRANIDRIEHGRGSGVQRLLRPRRKPVDCADVHERWEHAQPNAKCVADWRHAEDEVQVDAHARGEGAVQRSRRLRQAGGLGDGGHRVGEGAEVVLLQQMWQLARSEDLVDVGDERLADHLCVGEEEDKLLAVATRAQEQPLEVAPPLSLPVRRRELDLEALHPAHVRCQAGERPPPRAADAAQQRIAAWPTQDASDASDVPESVFEEHEAHALGGGGIVHVKVPFDGRAHLAHVRHLYVRPCVCVHEVAVEEVAHLAVDHLLPLEAAVAEELADGSEVLGHERHKLAVEPRAVVIVDEAVAEDAHGLVDPQPNEVGGVARRLRVGREHALHHGRNVAQVERVVALGGCGQQLPEQHRVELERRRDHWRDARQDRRREVRADKRAQDDVKDARHRSIIGLGEGDEGEVAEEAVGHDLTAAARWTHRADERDVDDLAPLARLAMVPAAVPEPQTQELEWRLRAVLFAHRHVDIVNEDGVRLTRGRAEDALAPFVELGVEQVLRLVGARLRIEADLEGRVLVGHAVRQLVEHRERLARASWPDAQHVEGVPHEPL